MKIRERLSGNEAVATAMKQINPDVVAAFPITPSTEIPQYFSTFVANGTVDTEFVAVESEHSAMSACIGAEAAGARAMTATSANGLSFMWEMIYIASSMRLPIVMNLVNRAVSGPLNIHNDHSDAMGVRDSGWIMLFSENNQEAYDNTLMAHRIAEHKDVQLLIFPECSLTGYPPRDISNSSCVNFNLVQSMCDRLQSVSDQNDISFIVGTIFKEKEIYNRALLFQPNKQIKSYDKRALWGWDNDNFAKGNSDGIVEIDGVVFGIRICFEIRFPEFFRELYKRNTDINVVLFYDVADTDDKERYSMIRGHLQTRAVENVTTTISVNATSPFQTAPTMVFGKSGQCIKECVRNKPELLIYDFEKTVNDFGENGRTSISNSLINW